MLSARGERGEKSDSFSRGNEQDRSPFFRFMEGENSKMFRWNIFDETSIFFSALPTLPSGRVSRQNAFVNEAVGGVDDPAVRWKAEPM
jgi:hypothetical protein